MARTTASGGCAKWGAAWDVPILPWVRERPRGMAASAGLGLAAARERGGSAGFTGTLYGMDTSNQKITLEVPRALLDEAQRASGEGITETVRRGLQMVARAEVYASLRRKRGTLAYTTPGHSWRELKRDR